MWREDVATGRWQTQRYQVSLWAVAPNSNWFAVIDFVNGVEGGGVIDG